MQLFQLRGIDKKTHVTHDIYVIAPDQENAIARASKFATELMYIEARRLDAQWDRFHCN